MSHHTVTDIRVVILPIGSINRILVMGTFDQLPRSHVNRKSLFRHSREKVRNCRERPPRTRLRELPAATGAANRPGLVLLSREYPITDCYVNLKSVFEQSWTLASAGERGLTTPSLGRLRLPKPQTRPQSIVALQIQ